VWPSRSCASTTAEVDGAPEDAVRAATNDESRRTEIGWASGVPDSRFTVSRNQQRNNLDDL
jgi:hypothetical protein